METSSGLGPTVIAVTWTEFTAGSVLMALRIYTNGFILRRWNPDFWWALSSYACALASSVFLTIGVTNGIGAHFVPTLLTPNPSARSQLHQLIFTSFSILAIAFGKMAVIQFILQLEGTNRTGKRILYLCAFCNFVVSFLFLPLLWTQCDPVDKTWDPTVRGSCRGKVTYTTYAYFQGGFGAFLDTALALYPAIMLWQLRLKMHVKLGLIILFGFGIVAAITALVKTLQIGTVKAKQDTTFHQGYLDIWASTNLWVVFIASCIPTIRPIIVRVIRKLRRKETKTSGTYVHEITFKSTKDSEEPNESKASRDAMESKEEKTSNRRGRGYSVVYAKWNKQGAKGNVGDAFESGETIVPGKDEIVMTTEYQVKYEERQESRVSLSEKGLERTESWEERRR